MTEENRSRKLEFINLYCKYVFKFTKMLGLNRYKAHKFALINADALPEIFNRGGGYLKGLKAERLNSENFAISFGKDNLILGLLR